MTIRVFLRDMWRFCLFFAIGVSLAMAVLLLSLNWTRTRRSSGDILYGALLAVLVLVVFVMVEYFLRRRYYMDAVARFTNDIPLSSIDIFRRPGTAEQRLHIRLLRRYYDVYMRELSKFQEGQALFERFSLRFAHQMKTPITVIQLLEGELKQLQEELAKVDTEVVVQLGATIQSLIEERERLGETVSTMLDTVRLNSFEFDAHMQDVDVTVLIRDVINNHKTSWIHRRIYPKIESPAEPVWVSSDQKWLQVLVEQIVRNAIQYGSKGESETRFIVDVNEQSDTVDIAFRDEGIGIAARDLERIFEPFFTGNNGRVHSRATGMGLYLAAEIAERLGHTLSVASTEGVGTTVTLRVNKPRLLSPQRKLFPSDKPKDDGPVH